MLVSVFAELRRVCMCACGSKCWWEGRRDLFFVVESHRFTEQAETVEENDDIKPCSKNVQ